MPVTIVRADPGDVAPTWPGSWTARRRYLEILGAAQAQGAATVTLQMPSGRHSARAVRVATATVREAETDLDVRLVVTDREAFDSRRIRRLAQALRLDPPDGLGSRALSPKRQPAPPSPARPAAVPQASPRQYEPVEGFDGGSYQARGEPLAPRQRAPHQPERRDRAAVPAPEALGLATVVENLDEPFATTLLHLVDAKNLTDVQVYRRANLDRRLFSKIRSNPAYMPSKRTALALAVGLGLDLDETRALLARAGYTLSSALTSDVIVEYFISRGTHDVLAINEALFYFDQPLLGG